MKQGIPKGLQPAPYSLRLPPDLRDRLEKSAKENERSLHKELIYRLQRQFQVAA